MATIRKVGAKYVAEVYVKGRRKSKRHNTKREAQQWAATMETELAALGEGVSLTHTLGDVFERYAEEVSSEKKGARWEEIRLAAFARYSIATVKVADLRRQHFDAWVAERLETVQPSSVNRELNLISHCLTEARRWGWMQHKPMQDLKRPKNPPPRDRRIMPDEIERILFTLNYFECEPVEQTKQRVAVAFLFAIETAMRAGEICALNDELVSTSRRVAHLPKEVTKNGFARDVPLSGEAVRLWERLPGGSFDLKPGSLSSIFRVAVREADIEGLTFHDTRHEAITRLSKKLDVLALARAVGHRNIAQLQTYYNESAEDLAKLL